MQNELKSAICFNDIVHFFGARGVVALSWWMGAAHAARIRNDQNSFPFLHIVGAAGSGKSMLLEYLQKLNGQTPRAHSLAHTTQAARAASMPMRNDQSSSANTTTNLISLLIGMN